MSDSEFEKDISKVCSAPHPHASIAVQVSRVKWARQHSSGVSNKYLEIRFGSSHTCG
jgi:hypothetical protein